MGKKFIRSYRRRVRAKLASKSIIFGVFVVVVATAVLIMAENKRINANYASYRPLLNLIADIESRDNYNAYYGNAHNSSIAFTDMTIAEVLQWQKEYVAGGSPSSAVGRYQIINTTLEDLVKSMGISEGQLYDEAMQDKLAVVLLERRGSVSYVNKEMSRQEFAANLAKEWASLPSVSGSNPDASYYDGDGLNKSLVNKEKVFGAIDKIEPEKQ